MIDSTANQAPEEGDLLRRYWTWIMKADLANIFSADTPAVWQRRQTAVLKPRQVRGKKETESLDRKNIVLIPPNDYF